MVCNCPSNVKKDQKSDVSFPIASGFHGVQNSASNLGLVAATTSGLASWEKGEHKLMNQLCRAVTMGDILSSPTLNNKQSQRNILVSAARPKNVTLKNNEQLPGFVPFVSRNTSLSSAKC